MTHEYDGLEKQFMIRNAEIESRHYEEQAEKCLRKIFDDSCQAYSIVLLLAARVNAYQTYIEALRRSERS
ncbi:MAG: hypothetical protein LBD94_00640 [Rickettsiales bacterium]|jgi:hypothetical protein|nr:hypothetical protein [Rickettsiales bacterium]